MIKIKSKHLELGDKIAFKIDMNNRKSFIVSKLNKMDFEYHDSSDNSRNKKTLKSKYEGEIYLLKRN